MIFSLYTVYKKRNDDKYWRLNQRKIASIIDSSTRIILLPTVWDNKGKECFSYDADSSDFKISVHGIFLPET